MALGLRAHLGRPLDRPRGREGASSRGGRGGCEAPRGGVPSADRKSTFPHLTWHSKQRTRHARSRSRRPWRGRRRREGGPDDPRSCQRDDDGPLRPPVRRGAAGCLGTDADVPGSEHRCGGLIRRPSLLSRSGHGCHSAAALAIDDRHGGRAAHRTRPPTAGLLPRRRGACSPRRSTTYPCTGYWPVPNAGVRGRRAVR